MKHVLAILVENRPGVLSKVAGLFGRRGFNIDSLAVGTTDHPDISRITIAVTGDEYLVEQLSKQLNKLIDVIKVSNIGDDCVARELILIKVHASPATRNEIVEIVNIFRQKIVDITKTSVTVEATGDIKKVEALIEMLRDFGVKEVVKTGMIAIDRGAKAIDIKQVEKKVNHYE
ncbi:acetolactate synthase small subunit [Tindallia californiensis]|uniref:Acetolactate synthase small subunit n=1 Tax=Tindallia californiensis TaxID=159292 RepID=A0A1H3JRA6_9FIRM|nr:acetolactate synthase small subunit [Tindallia californiensis]SDY42457.1 acetolactate synthase, small subunit [Tindallia californiensis]